MDGAITFLVCVSGDNVLAPLLCIPKDAKINPDVDFHEVYIDLRNIRDASFKVGSGHTKVFLPEQLLMTEREYQKQQQQQLWSQTSELEVSMSSVIGLSDIDIDRQCEMLAEANARSAKQHKEEQIAERERMSEAPSGEEGLAAGTGAHPSTPPHSTDPEPLAGMPSVRSNCVCGWVSAHTC